MVGHFHYTSLTERECRAIRCAHGGAVCQRNEDDMSISFKDRDGVLRVSLAEVAAYMTAWRKSGLWALRGLPTPTDRSDT